jgi:hypothetical protein
LKRKRKKGENAVNDKIETPKLEKLKEPTYKSRARNSSSFNVNEEGARFAIAYIEPYIAKYCYQI